jgi:transmembrane sensor
MAMTTNERQVADLITEQAAHWYVANRAGLSAQDRLAFSAWLKSSPLHIEEYLAISATSADLTKARSMSDEPLAELIARARADIHAPTELQTGAARVSRTWYLQRSAAFLAAASFVLCLIGWALWPVREHGASNEAHTPPVHFATRHGEQRRIRLADASIVHLNTDSSITVRYSAEERAVSIESGEVDFEVVHEALRQFRVSAGPAEVVAIGTNFNVRLGGDSAEVTVLTGRVAVGPSSTIPRASTGPTDLARWVQVGAGQQLNFSHSTSATPSPVDSLRTTAWLRHQISFEREPLERVVSEFNRYTVKPIEITTPVLRKLEISGVFATDDQAAFVAFLRSLDGVKVEETATQFRVSQR